MTVFAIMTTTVSPTVKTRIGIGPRMEPAIRTVSGGGNHPAGTDCVLRARVREPGAANPFGGTIGTSAAEPVIHGGPETGEAVETVGSNSLIKIKKRKRAGE